MIQAKLSGRMGNQMFQYSICRLVAEKKGYNFYIPGIGDPELSDSTEGHHLAKYFPNINLGIKDGNVLYRYVEDHNYQIYNDKIFNVPDNTYIYGFYQTDKYYRGHEDEVRSWFTVEKDEQTDVILNKYNIEEYCYIHIRGTDYKTHNHWLLSKKYYSTAIDKIKEINPNVSFVIITDDVEYSNEMFPDIDAITNEMMVDFKLIYYSEYAIISNSTFAWWAAWLRDRKSTISPSNWLNYNKPELGYHPIDIKTDKFIFV